MVYAKKDKVAQQLLTFVKIYYALDIYYCLRLYQVASNYFLEQNNFVRKYEQSNRKHSTNKEILFGQVKDRWGW